MDASVIAAIAKWPNVPDCRGWLSLDRRGQWRLQGSPVRHAGLAEFIGRNYACDETGAWFMQNGPQRVWVELGMTPWIFRLTGAGGIVTHTAEAAGTIEAAWLIDGEALCLRTTRGFGAVDDRDLLTLLGHFRGADGAPVDEIDDFESLELLSLHWGAACLPLQRCSNADLERVGGFRRLP